MCLNKTLYDLLFQGIYEYLAVYLPCSKETIQKRAKKLLLTDQVSSEIVIHLFNEHDTIRLTFFSKF